jgi:hypothetical protein
VPHRADGVEIFRDDLGIEQGQSVIQYQGRNFAQGIMFFDQGRLSCHGVAHQLKIDMFFNQDDAHLADEGAGDGTQKFHDE